jgi:hypothetical protein
LPSVFLLNIYLNPLSAISHSDAVRFGFVRAAQTGC